MAAKVLITGISNSGKSTLCKTLKNAFIISYDGKPCQLPMAHVNVAEFSSIDELMALVDEKIGAFTEKFKKKPDTIVFDSVSRILTRIEEYCTKKYSGFDIWRQVNNEINALNSNLGAIQEAGFNLVLITHVVFDPETKRFAETAKGSFAKIGGFTSVVDEAVNIDVMGNKRIVTHRGSNIARTLLDDIPDKEDANDFNLQAYIDKLNEKSNEITKKWSL